MRPLGRGLPDHGASGSHTSPAHVRIHAEPKDTDPRRLFDSVFPVGHPAREMHDTFFFKTVSPSRS